MTYRVYGYFTVHMYTDVEADSFEEAREIVEEEYQDWRECEKYESADTWRETLIENLDTGENEPF